MSDKPKNSTNVSESSGMIIGVCIGIAMGAALDNIALGVAIGVALGFAFTSRGKNQKKKENDRTAHDGNNNE